MEHQSARESGTGLALCLRRGTRHLHERIERLPAFAALTSDSLSRAHYRRFLARYAGHLFALEPPLRHALSRSAFLPYLGGSCRIDALERDLVALGIPADAIPTDPLAWFEPDDEAFALGVLYVHTGARLGAAVVCRHLGDGLQIDATRGAAYFCAPEQSPGWRRFVGEVDTCPQRGIDPARATKGARAAFGGLYEWMRPGPWDLPA